jgi:membrane protein implicated in regulation of membrane protease activity
VLAALTWRRQHVPWAMLVASAAGAALLSLVALPYSVAHLLASVIAVVLLMRPATRTWLRQERPVVPRQHHDWPPPTPQDQHAGVQAPEERPSGKPPVW